MADSAVEALFLALVALVLVVVPFITLYVVARSRGRSPVFVALGALSWFGVIIGLAWMAFTRPGGDGAP